MNFQSANKRRRIDCADMDDNRLTTELTHQQSFHHETNVDCEIDDVCDIQLANHSVSSGFSQCSFSKHETEALCGSTQGDEYTHRCLVVGLASVLADVCADNDKVSPTHKNQLSLLHCRHETLVPFEISVLSI